jgi:hypothetical protein
MVDVEINLDLNKAILTVLASDDVNADILKD